MGRPAISYVGHTNGRLVVEAETKKGTNRLLHCRCDCGETRDVWIANWPKATACFTHQEGLPKRGRPRSAAPKPPGPGRTPKAPDAWSRSLYAGYRGGAVRRGYSFDLSYEDFVGLITSPCHYCGDPASNSHEGYPYNGVDRVDNALGYSKANAVPACALCNYSKRDRSVDEFVAWAKRVAEHQEKLGNFPS